MDRENIVRLPAIHIIEDKTWVETIYPSIQALNIIERYYTQYVRLQRKRHNTLKRIGNWLFGRRSLKTDSFFSNSSVSTN